MGALGAVERATRAGHQRIAAVAREEPFLTGLVLAGAVVFLAALALLWRRYRRAQGEWFVRSLRDIEHADVLMHPDPDPDAMACALGIASIAAATDVETRLCYTGEIRHPENRAFRTVLEVECAPVESVADIDPPVVLVDHNEPRGVDGAAEISPHAVVDHHPGDGTGTEFTDVREEYGACASIVAEYFRDLSAEPGATDGSGPVLDAELSTGLVYGILTDTNRLTRGCSEADFDASAYLYPGIDEGLLDRIANPEVDTEVLEVQARAVRARQVKAPYAVSDVGTVSNADAIPQAADELLQLEGVSSVVVFGDSDGTLQLSGRSYDDRVHVGDALNRAVEDIRDANAGGHARMGGGRVPLERIDDPTGELSRVELRDRLFAVMAGER